MTRYYKYKKEHNKTIAEQSGAVSRSNVQGGKVIKRHSTAPSATSAVCLRCRQAGHVVKDCPAATADSKTLCYRCGSREHSLKQCTQPRMMSDTEESLPFAECYVCKGQGHLARSCPQNANGLYPNGGGCRVCGSTRHLQRDCTQQSTNTSGKTNGWKARENARRKRAEAVKRVVFK